MTNERMNIIGVMSGTSLDGLDIAYCSFDQKDGQYSFEIGPAVTIKYPKGLRRDLARAITMYGIDISLLDDELGVFIGNNVKAFIEEHNLTPDIISSHGHTVFHQPENGVTKQIGSGKEINYITKVPVINDFRTLDVSLGGQGAPLVPIGDKLLFSEYEYCLNLGGIANISMEKEGQRIAWDICPVNLALNHMAQKTGKEYDENGALASSGEINDKLLNQLNNLDYYGEHPPKSLGLEWVKAEIYPLIEQGEVNNILNTLCHHIAEKIADSILEKGRLLITGGGAYNDYLVQQIRTKTQGVAEVIIPDKQILEFKEALIFAFLGYLRWNDITNVLSSVTGASRDSVSGTIIQQY